MGPILLARSKKEADPSLTQVLFDQTDEIFLPQGNKAENLVFLGEIFQTQTQTKDG